VLILALDTTTAAGSLAVSRDGTVLYELVGDPSTSHAQRLPLDVLGVCTSAGVRLADIDLFAVAAGPGSFTGLRVGIASIQGLAFALGKKVLPVSTLEAIAAAAIVNGAPRVAAWMDAQRKQVFAQLFDVHDRDVVQPFSAAVGDELVQPFRAAGPPIAATPDEVLASWGAANSLAAVAFRGDGAVKYADVIRATVGDAADLAQQVPPLAGAIARLAAARPEHAVLPHAVAPVYVRRPDVELARDRRAGGA
jgi:tRNA threonylcarbamoyladenosine biosynthesis protein TsaB